MAYIRKQKGKWQCIIRKKGHPHIYKTFLSKADCNTYAQESERNIERGLFEDMTEANQTKLKDVLVRYRDEITIEKKGAKQESYKINKLIRNKIKSENFVLLNGDAIFNLDYENLINNSNNEIRNLIKFCGLSWDVNCLSPHKNYKSSISTARPIPASSGATARAWRTALGWWRAPPIRRPRWACAAACSAPTRAKSRKPPVSSG